MPGPKEYGVSHQVQRRLHPAVLTKLVRTPVQGPSPWMEWKISMIRTQEPPGRDPGEARSPLRTLGAGPAVSSEIEQRELRWQARWKEAGLAHARAVPGRPKHFQVFAYPGASGFLHLGHMRGYTYADLVARYHRMNGEQVFFPAGIHASGLPAIVFASRVARRDPDVLEGLRERGVPEAEIPRLEAPERAARFLGQTYWRLWERFGLLLDPETYLLTTDPDYQAFIRWQFLRLHDRGFLLQKPHYAPFCPRSGPVSVDSSETDIARGGGAEIITYVAVPFPLEDGRTLLAATLRPETVYGVTNLWLAPGSTLKEWHHEGRRYVVSERAVQKFLDQVGGTEGPSIPASSLVGREATVPLAGERVPILASPIVDPDLGTGVVMSVPAHAPADWLAAQDLGTSQGPALQTGARVLLDLPSARLSPSEQALFEGDGPPAARAIRALAIRSLDERERLQEATERVYRAEFAHGTMTVAPWAGLSVPQAREKVTDLLLREHGAFELREFSEPVVCRCGETVIIRRIPHQWFLAYGNPGWKGEAHETLSRMRLDPPEYAAEMPGILDWYDDRACVRQGRWLGTPFPFAEGWIIEPIADSTLYPAYYVVRRYVQRGQLALEQLTPAFFDFIFLGVGSGEPSLPRELQEEIRREFLYWYPLDLNLGGKEHKRVHFPVFIFNHAALFPPELRPRRILVHWWLTSAQGEKVSKKDVKGGAVPPVDRALQDWGADGLRLYFSLGATTFQDVEWDQEAAAHAATRAGSVLERLGEMLSPPIPPAAPSPGELELWLLTRTSDAVRRSRAAHERYDFRAAAEIGFVEIPQALDRYRVRGGHSPMTLHQVGKVWARLLSPITPHLAEEAYARVGDGLVAEAPFPQPEELPADPRSLLKEGLLERLEEDLASLRKGWKGTPSGLRIFVAAPWKHRLETWLANRPDPGAASRGTLLKELLQDPEFGSHRGELARYLDLALPGGRSGPQTPPELSPAEELTVLRQAQDYLSRRLAQLPVEVVLEEEAGDRDPQGRRGRARPGRPALYLWSEAVPGSGKRTPSDSSSR